MSDQLPAIPTPKLPFWMAGKELAKLASAAKEWFRRLGEWSVVPARQLDPMTASYPILRLLAHQRCITSYPGEPERLFRLRVKYAYANAKDAGLISGWKRIFARLELGKIELEERRPGQDWDIIGLVIDDSALPDRQNVLEIIIDEYGRTCRRYRFISRIRQTVGIGASSFDDHHSTLAVTQSVRFVSTVGLGVAAFGMDYSTMAVTQSVRFVSAVKIGIAVFDMDHSTMEAHSWA